MKSIDLSLLPRKKYGNQTQIDWSQSIGCKIPFCYEQTSGCLTVSGYEKGNYIIVEFNGKSKRLRSSHLSEYKFRDLIYPETKVFKSLDFSQVPKRYGRYDWVHSIGAKIPFIFANITGELEILSYKSIRGMGYLTVSYQQRQYPIRNINLLNGKIAGILDIQNFQYQIGENLIGEKRNLTIINRKKEANPQTPTILRKKYQYHCNLCGYEGWCDESVISYSRIICSHCAGKVAIPGKTDIITEAPWMIPYFQKKDRDLLKTNRKYSSTKIYPICTNCHAIRPTPIAISTIYVNHSISCPYCGDGVSYPEKFVWEFFRQLNVNLIFHPTQKELSWTKPYIYDFYDPKRQVIIEVNGMHHYAPVKHYGRSLEQVQQSDRQKYILALTHGISAEHYLSIDCRYSKLEYIQQSLCSHPQLRQIYPFRSSEIDWTACDQSTAKSLYWEIYRYHQRHPQMTRKQLAAQFQVCTSTISKAILKLQRSNSP